MKAMFEVIKYDGDNSNLVYKYPVEDFNTKSRLVVQQAQEAIFYYQGKMADRFDVPGTYVLESQNIPILRHLVNLPYGKESPFHAVVYFVNKTEQMNNKWGTGGIPFIDKAYPIPLNTGISGEYNFKVNDPEVFMDKLVGTLPEFSGTKLSDTLDSFLKSRVVNHLSKYYQSNDIDIFVIESIIEEIADYLEEKIKEDFSDYGIEITKFVVTSIAKHEDSAEYKRYFEFRTQQQALIDIQYQGARAAAEAQARMNVSAIEQTTQQDLDARKVRVDAEAAKYKRDVEGYTYQQERGFDVAEKTAQNEGAGNFAAAGIGFGMGYGAMGAAAQAVGGMYTDALSQVSESAGKQQAFANTNKADDNLFMGGNVGLGYETETSSSVTSAFSHAGTEVNDQKSSRTARLLELKEHFEAGLIDEEDYKQRKAEILSEI